jgi:hypothetical protein
VIDTSLAERQRAGDTALSGPLPGACKYHPEKMTRLRCNVCGEPICPRCARRRSAGYSCDDCIQELAGKFYNGNWRDYVLAVAIALPLSLVAGAVFTLMVGAVGYYGVFITLVGAPVAGGFLAEAVRWAVRKRRSRHLGRLVVGCLVLGAIPLVGLALLWGDGAGLVAGGVWLFTGGGTILARLW